MMTAEIAFTEEERDVMVDQLRGLLQSLDESGIEKYSDFDSAPLEAFDKEYWPEVKIVQSILRKLGEAF